MVRKYKHEVRDPIHVFICLDTDERKILDSRALQRLRHIHQLALTYLVYPGATHCRFEHSLGVMELASRVYDIITQQENVYHESVRRILPQYESIEHKYWRRVLRMAALCHDIGHLPFSHAAAEELLPDGWDHERITSEIIRSDEMRDIWNGMTVALKVEDIIKVALGPKKAKDVTFTEWDAILSEIIVGDTFGVDRVDYLLRDSLHTGVAYGKFDHYRLIDTFRILPKGGTENDSEEPTLGLHVGGLQSAEALLWARYFMYSQVYCHAIRRIYDIHLKDFLQSWLKNGKFSPKIGEHLGMTDNEVVVELRKAALDPKHPGHLHAKRIITRDHFKLLYTRNPDDLAINPNAGDAVYDAACDKFGAGVVRYDKYRQKGGSQYFPVLCKDDRILQSVELSDTLRKMPVVATEFVFVQNECLESAQKWLEENRKEIIKPEKECEE